MLSQTLISSSPGAGYRMRPEDQHVSYFIQSHGPKLARFHLYNWLVLILLFLLDLILKLVIHPFRRFVAKDMMSDLTYPLQPNTVPTWSISLYSILLPTLVFLIYYLRRRNVYDLHNATLGLLYAVLITAVITDAIKDGVGRPRPDFFWRCFPDGIDFYDELGNVICHGDKRVMREAYKSFPSGHTSWAFAGLGFLSLYLAGKIEAYDQRGHIAKLCVVLLPLLAAALVGISRVDDYWHHWQDVFAGGLIGFLIAIFCYHQFFPPPYHQQGQWPHAYLQLRKEERLEIGRVRFTNEINDPNSPVSDDHLLDQQRRSRSLDSPSS